MSISLVTDSTCDLPDWLIAQHQIHVIPMNIQFGTTSYQENITLTPHEFYTKVQQRGEVPQTSCPAVGEFSQVYNTLAAHSTDIISIHITGKLSGTCQSANLAAAQIADQVHVHVVDSLSGSLAQGWMLCDAATLRDQGKTAAQIVSVLEAKRPAITILFAVDNLKFARMSGRVGKLAGVLGSILNIKPIIGLENGVIDVWTKTRSNRNALAQIITLTREQVQNRPINLGVVHACAEERGKTLLQQSLQTFNVQDYLFGDVATSLAVHFGPGTIGLITYPAAPPD